MQKSDSLIRTKLQIPLIRPSLVARTRLQQQIGQGLRGPFTLLVAPAGFGKTTLLSSCIQDCGMAVAWLSLDKSDNESQRFLSYVVAAFRQADRRIGNEAAQFILAPQQVSPDIVLTSLINDLESVSDEVVLILDDYHFISSQAVHAEMTFLLEHCPHTLHIVISTRSDPPLPVARLRGRGQILELRAADLRFTEPETTHFLNAVMGLQLDAQSVAVLAERTEGWIAGLQMAALSMHDHKDVPAFIKGFSGTNRYILDYLLEEVLAGQSPEIQHFLLCTSILERLSAPLCDAVLANDEERDGKGDNGSADSDLLIAGQSGSILEYLERANLFLVPLDDERQWYRYHHLFADLLRTQLQKSLDALGIAQLHIRAADWHEKKGSLLEAIHHASMASDEERVESFIEQHYMELVNRGEQSWLRFWTGKLSKELVLRRPWLCIYEAYSHSWFGELDQADLFLDAAEKRIRSDSSLPDAASMLGHLTYIRSRVTAMRGDIPRAIEFNLAARQYLPVIHPALQLDLNITLGYLYFLNGDYSDAGQFLNETIRSGRAVGAVLNPVAACCLIARLHANQGLLHQAYDLYLQAAQWIDETGEQHRGASSIIEVGLADVFYEWNDLDAALTHVKQGLDWIHLWAKADDLILAYITMARIHQAQANISAAQEAMERVIQVIRTSAVFPEAPHALELAQVKLWLSQGDIQAASHWVVSVEQRFDSDDPFRFEDELTHIAEARVWIAQNKLAEATRLLSRLEEIARSAGRMGRVIEVLLLQALALQKMGDAERSLLALTKCLSLAELEGYVRIFLDEGQPMHVLLTRWLVHADPGPIRDYANRLLAQFDAERGEAVVDRPNLSAVIDIVDPLTPRELEVLRLVAAGLSNRQIAAKLVLSEGTIKFYMHAIMQKLGVHSRTQALLIAREQNLV
jgi:LuxR family maltose regulon positive regulatory protein